MPPDTERQHALVTEHLGLVHAIAKKIAAQSNDVLEYDELVACGREGLVQAARRYDPDRGATFATFAYYRIRGAMFDGLRRLGPLVDIGPKTAFEERADEYLEQRARQPAPGTAVEATERLTTMVSDLATAYVLCSDQMHRQPDTSTPDAAQVAEAREELSLVSEHLARLPDRERRLVEMMYFEGLTMKEAATRLDMSKGWASRLHARALSRLRKGTSKTPARHPALGP